MKLELWNQKYSLQWNSTYHLALVDYPNIQEWELEKIAAFMAYERLNQRIPQIVCHNPLVDNKIEQFAKGNRPNFPFTPSRKIVASTFDSVGNCVYSDFVSHTCTVETAQKILESGKLLSAVKAFNKTPAELVTNPRNAAGDPEDYFQYVMFGWSNTTSGYRLAMERLLGKMPTDFELEKGFIPGVSFHFKYDDIISLEGYVFDGYHAAKVKDSVGFEKLHSCIIPLHEKEKFESIIPENLTFKVYYIEYSQEDLKSWSDKVYHIVENLTY